MIQKFIPFERTEYDRRLAKTRAAMEDASLDVLFVTDPSNQNWLTAYDGWSFYVHQGVIVFPDRDPVWWGRRQDANGAVRTVWMEDDCVRGYADHFVQSTVRHPMQDLAAFLEDLGQGSARIGVEMDNYYFSAKAMQVLEAGLPNARFSDATALVNWQRAIKSDAELEFIRKAGGISQKIVEGLMERVEPGIPKNEVVAEIYRDAIRAPTGFGATIRPLCRCCRRGQTRPRRTLRGMVESLPAVRRHSLRFQDVTDAITRRSAARFSLEHPMIRYAGPRPHWLRGLRRGSKRPAPGIVPATSPMHLPDRLNGRGSNAVRAVAIPSG